MNKILITLALALSEVASRTVVIVHEKRRVQHYGHSNPMGLAMACIIVCCVFCLIACVCNSSGNGDDCYEEGPRTEVVYVNDGPGYGGGGDTVVVVEGGPGYGGGGDTVVVVEEGGGYNGGGDTVVVVEDDGDDCDDGDGYSGGGGGD